MTTTSTERPAEAVDASILARDLIAVETEDVLLYGQNDNEVHPDYLPALEAVRDSGHPALVAAKLASFASSAIRELAHVYDEDPRATLHRLTAKDCGH